MVLVPVSENRNSLQNSHLLNALEQGSNLVSSRGSNKNLNEIGAERGLSRYMKLNSCQKGTAPPTTMEFTVEAIIGAVWEDSGKDLDRVRVVVREHWTSLSRLVGLA